MLQSFITCFHWGVHLVGEYMVGAPGRVPALHEAEDEVAVHVIGIGEAVLQHDGLESEDMVPGG